MVYITCILIVCLILIKVVFYEKGPHCEISSPLPFTLSLVSYLIISKKYVYLKKWVVDPRFVEAHIILSLGRSMEDAIENINSMVAWCCSNIAK